MSVRPSSKLDYNKWWFAIEMEIWVQQEDIIKECLKNLSYIDYVRKSESTKITEYNIKDPDIQNKSVLYESVYYSCNLWDKYPVWADWHISGGNHFHLFLNDFNSIASKQGIAAWMNNVMLSLPLFGKISNRWIHHRYNYSWRFSINKDFSSSIKWCSIARRTEHNSFEFRVNEIIHPWMLYYYMYVLDIWCDDYQVNHYPKLEWCSDIILWDKNYYSWEYMKNISDTSVLFPFEPSDKMFILKRNLKHFIRYCKENYNDIIQTKWWSSWWEWLMEYTKPILLAKNQ